MTNDMEKKFEIDYNKICDDVVDELSSDELMYSTASCMLSAMKKAGKAKEEKFKSFLQLLLIHSNPHIIYSLIAEALAELGDDTLLKSFEKEENNPEKS